MEKLEKNVAPCRVHPYIAWMSPDTIVQSQNHLMYSHGVEKSKITEKNSSRGRGHLNPLSILFLCFHLWIVTLLSGLGAVVVKFLWLSWRSGGRFFAKKTILDQFVQKSFQGTSNETQNIKSMEHANKLLWFSITKPTVIRWPLPWIGHW